MKPENQTMGSVLEQNAELENYFGNTIIPQLFVDKDLVLRKFTPPAMKQFSLVSSDIGRSMLDIKDNFRYPTLIYNIGSVMESGESLENEIQTTDRSWYQMNILPYIQRENNKTNGVIITFVDITPRIKVLKDHEKLISDHETLLDTLAHDIKNPLGNLVLTIDQLKHVETSNQADFDIMIEIVERALYKITNIINELGADREQEHKYKSNVELLALEDVIEDVRLTLTEDIQNCGATLKRKIQASAITFSRRKLRSILYNLIHNALKYKSPARTPEILISSVYTDDKIVITVVDNGIGIDKSKQEVVFAKYYRIDHSISGSGLGLYLVKQLVESSEGKILLESEPDKGTKFTIILKRF